MNKNIKGFTLLELMIVIAIVSIFAVIAAPGISSMARTNAASSYADTLYTALLLAKSEASKRSELVTLSGVNNQWQQGWQIKQGNTVLRTFDALPANYSLTTTNNATSIGFRPDGSLSSSAGFVFHLEITTNCEQGLAKQISISTIGLLQVSEAACGG